MHMLAFYQFKFANVQTEKNVYYKKYDNSWSLVSKEETVPAIHSINVQSE